jgi:predicted flap endonuclease-1-like 5' DNA nuclease
MRTSLTIKMQETSMTNRPIPATQEEIAALAYKFWEEEGRPHGRDAIHWQRATEALLQPEAAAPKAKPAAIDISLIDGIGPVLAKKLKEAGFATLADVAGLTLDALNKLDAKLGLKGRAVREDWIAQAKELIAGAAPRAKVDQKKAKAKA